MAITHAAGLAAADAGADAILCCTRSGRTALAMARFRPAAAADRPVARPGDRAGDGAVVGRALAAGRHVRDHRRAGLVRRRVRRARGARQHRARPCWCWPAHPTVRAVQHRRAADRARRVSGLWSEEAGAADDPLVVVIHGSMDRSAGMLKLSRRLDDDFRVLRYDRRGYGRSFPARRPVRDGRPGRRSRRAARRPPSRADRAQLRRQRRAGDGGSSSRSRRRGRGLRDAVVVGAVVARIISRIRRRRRGGTTEDAAEAVHAPHDRRSSGGRSCPSAAGGPAVRGRGAGRRSWPTCDGNRPWTAAHITCPWWSSFGSAACPPPARACATRPSFSAAR